MKTNLNKFLITISFAAFLCIPEVSAQEPKTRMVPSGVNAERIVDVENLHADVSFMTDTLYRGRETGTRGASEMAFWIATRYMGAGLTPLGKDWSHSFRHGGRTGRNMVGFMPGGRNRGVETYTIVAAHYDNLGMIEGRLFPGADSNASGVVAMLTVVDMFARMKQLGRSYGGNIIFVALDGKEKDSAGAEALVRELRSGALKDPVSGETITEGRIRAAVVLDILGSTLEPVDKGRPDYLIMLSDGRYVSDLKSANGNQGLGLDLSFDYYGSRKFTEMFHGKIGDQAVFASAGLPNILFTSGITMKTNKTSDTAETLDYEILAKRIKLIFHWLTKVI